MVNDADKRTDFWMKVAGISFALWSVVVGFATKSITDFQKEFSAYVLLTERRVTLLEERHVWLAKQYEALERSQREPVK